MLFVVVVVAARIREILENVGLAQESLPSNVVSSAQVLANVANLLNIRDTELSRWVSSFDLTSPFLCIFVCLVFIAVLDSEQSCVFLAFLWRWAIFRLGRLVWRRKGLKCKRIRSFFLIILERLLPG